MRGAPLALLLAGLGALLLFWKRAPIVNVVGSAVEQARALIAGEEGLRLTAYQDTGGAWTIGYGHLIRPGERFHPYGSVRTITSAEAESLFAADLRAAQAAVANAVRRPLSPNQRAALESLAFNIGGAAFATSTLVRRLNVGDILGAAQEFGRWVYDNGVKVAGLVNRRDRERTVFLA